MRFGPPRGFGERQYIHVEKFDEVASIGRYDGEIMVEGIFPDLMVELAG
jgi:hypothetical protein